MRTMAVWVGAVLMAGSRMETQEEGPTFMIVIQDQVPS